MNPTPMQNATPVVIPNTTILLGSVAVTFNIVANNNGTVSLNIVDVLYDQNGNPVNCPYPPAKTSDEITARAAAIMAGLQTAVNAAELPYLLRAYGFTVSTGPTGATGTTGPTGSTGQ